jgi:hypothetical protein
MVHAEILWQDVALDGLHNDFPFSIELVFDEIVNLRFDSPKLSQPTLDQASLRPTLARPFFLATAGASVFLFAIAGGPECFWRRGPAEASRHRL